MVESGPAGSRPGLVFRDLDLPAKRASLSGPAAGREWIRRFSHEFEASALRQVSGGFAGGATPVPIPNTEVKPSRADGTAGETLWESRTPPGLFPEAPARDRERGFHFS